MRVVDKEAFLDTFQYFDKSIVVEIIDIFIAEYPERMATIKSDIEKLDFDALKFDAHSIKGVISNFVAAAPQELSKTLEMKGASKDGSELMETFERLEVAGAGLIEDLKELKLVFME
ncbi:MAG: Hpt domain-containing protein [Bacteroidetes bacterium]|nr:Hpt domain-containing protein [Bacteroidota bacterium]